MFQSVQRFNLSAVGEHSNFVFTLEYKNQCTLELLVLLTEETIFIRNSQLKPFLCNLFLQTNTSKNRYEKDFVQLVHTTKY